MDVLFIKDPGSAISGQQTAGDEERLLNELQGTLEQLRAALHNLLLESRSNRKEARQWLINSIAGLDLTDAATKRRRFAQFLPGGAACRGAEHRQVAEAMLQLLFDAAPAEVGALVAQDASLLRHFFKSDPKRVQLWFGHFSMEGMRRFKHGAAALAQYALANRAEIWQLLAWQGRHPQAPVAVAQRPHYFCELDVPRSVRHLLRDCPGFWSSREMRHSVEEGAAQLLGLDPGFWSKELLRWLEDKHSAAGDRLHALLCRCLEQGPWRQHCQRLLMLLPQQDLLPFAVDLLGGSHFPGSSSGGGGGGGGSEAAQPAAAGGGAWLVFRRAQWRSLEQLTLFTALGCSLPLLLRLLRDEEWQDERRAVEQLVGCLLLLPATGGAAGQATPAAEQQAVEQPVRQQQEQEHHQQQQHVAAHWCLRRQLASSAVSEVQLHEMLLLHLFAAAFLVQQLSSSSSSSGDAEQLQQLLTASGLPCELIAAGSSSGGQHGERDKRRRRHSSGSRHKHGKRRHSSKHKGSSRNEKRRKKEKKGKRRRSSYTSSDGGSSGSGSSSEASDGGGSDSEDEGAVEIGLFGTAVAPGEQPAQQWLWRVQRPDGSSSTASSLELVDLVIDCTSWAYARWLLGWA
ncbi:hypothetical protein C2E21_5142 [Chlorella sorokiniana]|uniref:Uncharacterized protein n=1 Tax=Chlorella sorokiniana TaxID=3076 RepID=A0A2P6TQ66_CHLSO|nr:hypothetical protein C2E21_5142 [Chlorella sorokiniana]|eukprot:PRW56173.1 hypothetical protein C2E21_5142 [Chlorella sorokiniana]